MTLPATEPETRPAFSVLLPTHDRADIVGYAVESVLTQTVHDFELLVVGDGCTDGTADVIGSFDDDRIRWFDLPKAPGFGYANRNRALRGARGELVAFMAHDDLLMPDHLERMGPPFEDPRVEWAYSRPMWVTDTGTMIPFAVDLRRGDHLADFLEVRNPLPASCVVHRRSCLDRYGWWDEELERRGDWDLWRRMVGPSGGHNLAYVPVATALHFRADWRRGPTWGPAPLASWSAEAGSDPSWPRALRPSLREGRAPQAEFMRAMAADPSGWTADVRSATLEAIDALAWNGASRSDGLRSDLGMSVRAMASKGAHAKSIEVGERAVAAFPGDAELLGDLAYAYLKAGQHARAEQAARAALRVDPSRPFLHERLSLALAGQDRVQEAITQARTGLAARPDFDGRPESSALRAHLGRLLLRVDRPAEALRELEQARRLDPSRLDIRDDIEAASAAISRA